MSNSTQFSFPIEVTVLLVLKITYAIGVVLSVIRAFLSLRNGHSVALFLFFIGLSILFAYTFLLSRSIISVDNEAITLSTPHGLYKITWGEVETIEIRGKTIAFIGDNKHLVINLLLAGKGKREFYNFLNSELIHNRQIKVRPLASGRIRQKNTKVI